MVGLIGNFPENRSALAVHPSLLGMLVDLKFRHFFLQIGRDTFCGEMTSTGQEIKFSNRVEKNPLALIRTGDPPIAAILQSDALPTELQGGMFTYRFNWP